MNISQKDFPDSMLFIRCPEEGRVVVNITVNPAGVVIGTSINPQTNTVNSTLRKAAEDAAKKARFNTVEGPNNQTGTITYDFNLR